MPGGRGGGAEGGGPGDVSGVVSEDEGCAACAFGRSPVFMLNPMVELRRCIDPKEGEGPGTKPDAANGCGCRGSGGE